MEKPIQQCLKAPIDCLVKEGEVWMEKAGRAAEKLGNKISDMALCLVETPVKVHPLVDTGDNFIKCLKERGFQRDFKIFRDHRKVMDDLKKEMRPLPQSNPGASPPAPDGFPILKTERHRERHHGFCHSPDRSHLSKKKHSALSAKATGVIRWTSPSPTPDFAQKKNSIPGALGGPIRLAALPNLPCGRCDPLSGETWKRRQGPCGDGGEYFSEPQP